MMTVICLPELYYIVFAKGKIRNNSSGRKVGGGMKSYHYLKKTSLKRYDYESGFYLPYRVLINNER